MGGSLARILKAATLAPSGENAQPWSFHVTEDTASTRIKIHIDPDRDISPYGWGSRASYVAIGAALENIKAAATAEKLSASIELFPSTDSLHVATVELIAGDVQLDPCAGAVYDRVTNRKEYYAKAIPEEILTELSRTVTYGNAHIRFTTDTDERHALAYAGSTNEEVMLANESLHNYFFSHINWTATQDARNKIGFYIKTLELPLPAVLGFKLMRSWRRAKFFNSVFGMNSFVKTTNAKIYEKSPAIGIVFADTESPESAVQCGMTLERLWLEATRHGLSLQPIAGLLYLHLRLRAADTQGFTEHEQNMIETAYTTIDRTFQLSGRPAYFMFRIGYADSPSAQAVRFPVAEVSVTE